MRFPREFQNKAIILGVKIDDQPLDFVLKKIDFFLNADGQRKIFTPNPEICLRAEKDGDYLHVLNSADINCPDGFGLKLGAIILGQTLTNRVAGSDLTPAILKKFSQAKIFVVIRTDSLSTADDIKSALAEKYPRIKCKVGEVDARQPANCDAVLNAINSYEPEILFVCLGAPTQEIWINKYLKFLPSVKVALGVGGSFDFITEKIKRAPKVMRELGMEWLYRLYQEPKRLERIKHATADFLLACHKWAGRIKREMRPNVLGVIRNRQGLFLIQKNLRYKEHWQFPQGGIDEGEGAAAAVIREVSEEVGAPENLFRVVKEIPEKHAYIWPEYSQLLKGYKGQAQTAFIIDFIGKDTDFDLSHSHEVAEIKWVVKEDLLKYIHPDRQEFVRIILKYL